MSNPPLLTAPLLTKHGFRHGFSTRHGGVSQPPFDSLNLAASVGDEPDRVAENQRRFAASVGYGALFTLSQVHGRAVRVVAASDEPARVRLEQGDALVAPAGLAVGVRSADCVPVLLVDPETRHVAAVHAGWRGVLAGVVPAAVEVLCATSGAPSSRLCAALFPHIRRCCFEVDAGLAQQLSAANTGVEQSVFELQAPAAASRDPVAPAAGAAGSSADKALVALDVIVRAQLLARGLLAENIDDVPGCTVCEPQRFFSYRRDGARSGRHLTVVLG